MFYNVLAGVVRIIEADSDERAAEIFQAQLERAGFTVYPWLKDNLPDYYRMVIPLGEPGKE